MMFILVLLPLALATSSSEKLFNLLLDDSQLAIKCGGGDLVANQGCPLGGNTWHFVIGRSDVPESHHEKWCASQCAAKVEENKNDPNHPLDTDVEGCCRYWVWGGQVNCEFHGGVNPIPVSWPAAAKASAAKCTIQSAGSVSGGCDPLTAGSSCNSFFPTQGCDPSKGIKVVATDVLNELVCTGVCEGITESGCCQFGAQVIGTDPAKPYGCTFYKDGASKQLEQSETSTYATSCSKKECEGTASASARLFRMLGF